MPTFYSGLSPSRRAPTATFHDSKHNIVHVHFDATRGWLLTSGTDKVIKVRCHLVKLPIVGSVYRLEDLRAAREVTRECCCGHTALIALVCGIIYVGYGL